MGSLLNAIRKTLGIYREASATASIPEPTTEAAWVREKLEEQTRIIRALDAQVDAQRNSRTILKRRRGDAK